MLYQPLFNLSQIYLDLNGAVAVIKLKLRKSGAIGVTHLRFLRKGELSSRAVVVAFFLFFSLLLDSVMYKSSID